MKGFMTLIITILLFVLAIDNLYAQKEAYNWYFGEGAGMTFATLDGKPAALTDGVLMAAEGCAAISDKNGSLLFYSDGRTVWNKNHNIMEWGEGLKGGTTPAQCFIVGKPGFDNLYYLFTVDDFWGSNGLKYSIIDMNGNSGLGVVIEKNLTLLKPATEKLTAVYHNNGKDIWIIAHAQESDAFYSFLLTKYGISDTVISHTGYFYNVDNQDGWGYLKASPDGSMLATAIAEIASFEVFDFNNATGEISNPRFIRVHESFTKNAAYGVEFSPDSKKLYGTLCRDTSVIYQFNLEIPTAEAINLSASEIFRSVKDMYMATQLAPDGRIYILPYRTFRISCINNPDESGSACNYIDSALYLAGKKTYSGLPGFLQSYFDGGCGAKSFGYNDFSKFDGLNFVKSAFKVNNFIRLTGREPNISGAIWRTEPVPVGGGFKSIFKFRFSGGFNDFNDGSAPGADGIAFVIQCGRNDICGLNGGGLGYMGLSNSIAIEYDVYKNDFDLNDPDGNHIAIFSNKSETNSSDHKSNALIAGTSDILLMLSDSSEFYSKIEYNPDTKNLKIYLDTNGQFLKPALTVNDFIIEDYINLFQGSSAFVGLTAATGNSYQNQDILYWDYCQANKIQPTDVNDANFENNNDNCISITPNPAADYIVLYYNTITYGIFNAVIYDALGNKILEKYQEITNSGQNKITINVTNFNSGVYFISTEFSGTKKMNRLLIIK
ncbi:MAG: hypothetical protein QG635_1886 [Bacteroidota bacterium]|nr:hypothetical protein [Bacteroidota bacterium]